jgi:acyl-CoA reductase-like NAD-dependent aldehyde dehydrogenase
LDESLLVISMEYRNYIGGKWVPASSGKTYSSVNPANEEMNAEIPAADERDIELAIQSTSEDFRSWWLTHATGLNRWLMTSDRNG